MGGGGEKEDKIKFELSKRVTEEKKQLEEKLGGSKFSLFLRSDFRFLSFDLDDLVLPQFCASWAMEVIG